MLMESEPIDWSVDKKYNNTSSLAIHWQSTPTHHWDQEIGAPDDLGILD